MNYTNEQIMAMSLEELRAVLLEQQEQQEPDPADGKQLIDSFFKEKEEAGELNPHSTNQFSRF